MITKTNSTAKKLSPVGFDVRTSCLGCARFHEFFSFSPECKETGSLSATESEV